MKIDLFKSKVIARSSEERIDIIEKGNTDVSENYMDFGYDYFDNSELGVGYGGYKYDGRYAGVVKDICDYYNLKKGDRVLEIGCAKGFVLVEFQKLGMDVVGLDKSEYAIENCHAELKGKIGFAQSSNLEFDDNEFDLILGKEVLPHISKDDLEILIKECIRTSKKNIFFEIQTGRNKSEIEGMLVWDRTHKTLETPEWWDKFLEDLNYQGDVNYKVLIPDN
jgi:2-polyprenyl-3-methyl-5-hydroxy-6-metoxy-1,4-benzoquinol methylase